MKKLIYSLFLMALFTSCNKEVFQPGDINQTIISDKALDRIIKDNPQDSLFYLLVQRGGQDILLSSLERELTVFVPNNEYIKPAISDISQKLGYPIPLNSGNEVYADRIKNKISPSLADSLMRYNMSPGRLNVNYLSPDIPNFPVPSLFNPVPSFVPPILTLSLFPSRSNGSWINNTKVIQETIIARNGIIHHTEGLLFPPNKKLWYRISNDPELAYLEAAIIRADNGDDSSQYSLQFILDTIGPNITVFAPTNEPLKDTLKRIIIDSLVAHHGYTLISAEQEATTWTSSAANLFSGTNLLRDSILTPINIKLLLLYHVIGKPLFTNNFRIPKDSVNTILYDSVISLPNFKLVLNYELVGDIASVKGSANPFPAPILSNNNLSTFGDNRNSIYANGILHKINAVLMPY